jgi:hypothetical protein
MVIVCSRLPGTPFRVADRPVAFTERGQHIDRQTLEPSSRSARSLRSTAWASNAERRAACLTDC